MSCDKILAGCLLLLGKHCAISIPIFVVSLLDSVNPFAPISNFKAVKKNGNRGRIGAGCNEECPL